MKEDQNKMDAIDIARYFFKKLKFPNTFDGNMTMQKLLVFANLISLTKNGKTLFDENVYAYKNGAVVEEIRLKYKNDYKSFLDSIDILHYYSEEQYDIMNTTIDIFGNIPARELSEINHQFNFWKNHYKSNNGKIIDKKEVLIPVESMKDDLPRMREILAAYESTKMSQNKKETVNGVNFYYNTAEVDMTDELIDKLYMFSQTSDEKNYTVYYDNNELVIY